ncbi:uncharacterized protein LOC62_07G009465 [Vanrija pseudolonga]|uniref:Uncharacterized protein n=1 Tax=Vanrija pseudolonga TaxID=143232 RepID=A0AAF1BM82_9TREE|nr:hypothetical protein LOC62_07G009465 [Vanrija pseudolonga]
MPAPEAPDEADEPSSRPSKRARLASESDDEMDLDWVEVVHGPADNTEHEFNAPNTTTAEVPEEPTSPCTMAKITGTTCSPCRGHTPRELLQSRLAAFNAALATHEQNPHAALIRARAEAGLVTIAEYAAWFDRVLHKRTVATEHLVRNTPIALGHFYAAVGRARAAYVASLDDKMRDYLDVLACALHSATTMEMGLVGFELALAGFMMAFERRARDEHSRHLRRLESSTKTIRTALARMKRGGAA